MHYAESELFGTPKVAQLLRTYTSAHIPDFMTHFDPEKPRTPAPERPPRFCSLSREERVGVFGGDKPSLEAVAGMIRERRCEKIVVLTGAGIR